MEETRTSKYKEYRNSILKEDAPISFSSKDVINHESDNNTLPIDQVIEKKEEPKKFDAVLFFRKHSDKIKIIAIVVGLLLIILGIIVWAIKVWGY